MESFYTDGLGSKLCFHLITGGGKGAAAAPFLNFCNIFVLLSQNKTTHGQFLFLLSLRTQMTKNPGMKYQLVQSLQKRVQRFLKLEIKLPYDPVVRHLGNTRRKVYHTTQTPAQPCSLLLYSQQEGNTSSLIEMNTWFTRGSHIQQIQPQRKMKLYNV